MLYLDDSIQRIYTFDIFPWMKLPIKRREKTSSLSKNQIMKIPGIEGYEISYPEIFKAVAIAENGLGDCVGLIPKRDNDYELSEILFFLW